MIKSILSLDFTKYIIVGLVSMGIEMTLLITLVEYMNIPYLESNLFAFLFTNVVNYVLSRLWVFERSGRRKRVEFFWFALFVTISLLISQAIMWYGVDFLKIDYKITKLISIAAIVAWNFLTRKHFVFSKKQSANSQPSN
jgi:putative flippase GtrA